MSYQHIPVMIREVLEYLNPQPGQFFVDCTLGGAGYTIEIAKRVGNSGGVISIDLDREAIDNALLRIKKEKLDNVVVIHGNFGNLKQIVENSKYVDKKISGIVLDLGFSSNQIESKTRGFSFRYDAPLDMRFSSDNKTTAAYIVNKYPEKELVRIFKEYGEEKYAKKIARSLITERKKREIKTTKELVDIIRDNVPKNYLNSKIHFATRIFQALRIETNNELGNLKEVLPQALNLLSKNGILAVVSFHSLEDRIVKNFLKQESINCLCPPELPVCRCGHAASFKIITKKAITPKEIELKINPRSRSAKLRVAKKL